MVEESAFRESLGFLEKIGILDVVLPFLLVFVVVFALLDKTRVLGTEKVGEHEYPKKNINSLAAFVIAFFVVASSKLVEIVTNVSANVVLLLLAGTFFLLVAGSFHQQKTEGFFLEKGFKNLFMIITFLGVAFIFLNAIKTNDRTWLDWTFSWLRQFMDNASVSSVVLVVIIIAVMYYIGAFGRESGQQPASGTEHK